MEIQNEDSDEKKKSTIFKELNQNVINKTNNNDISFCFMIIFNSDSRNHKCYGKNVQTNQWSDEKSCSLSQKQYP